MREAFALSERGPLGNPQAEPREIDFCAEFHCKSEYMQRRHTLQKLGQPKNCAVQYQCSFRTILCRCSISLSLSSGEAQNCAFNVSDEIKLLMDSVPHRLGFSSREFVVDFLVACRDVFGMLLKTKRNERTKRLSPKKNCLSTATPQAFVERQIVRTVKPAGFMELEKQNTYPKPVFSTRRRALFENQRRCLLFLAGDDVELDLSSWHQLLKALKTAAKVSRCTDVSSSFKRSRVTDSPPPKKQKVCSGEF